MKLYSLVVFGLFTIGQSDVINTKRNPPRSRIVKPAVNTAARAQPLRAAGMRKTDGSAVNRIIKLLR
jgi:hypothetical protein